MFKNKAVKIAIASLSSIATIGFIGAAITGIGICPVNTWFKEKQTISKNNLTIGVYMPQILFYPLITHLKCNLKNVQITLVGNHRYSYQDAKSQIAQKNWDLAFAASPMVAIASKDNNYTFATRTYPNSPKYYKSAIFTKKDSNINSIQDIKEDTKIALGDVNSTGTFYMPVYDLYGVKANIDVNINGIYDKVKSGEYDVGVRVYNNLFNSVKFQKELKILQVSRDIPGGGVYLSPELNKEDQKIIKDVLVNASYLTQSIANYGPGKNPAEDKELDYTEFTKIARKVENALSCTDFDAPVVSLFCSESTNNTISGQIKAYKLLSKDSIELSITSIESEDYSVILSQSFIDKPDTLINKQIKIFGVEPVIKEGKILLIINNSNQIKI